jgi:hypothetical protein
MEETYTQLETEAKEAISQSYSEDKIDNQKLAQLKSIGQQLTFAKKLAQKECYQIPIETNRGINNINLTIIRGTQTSGKVSVAVQSEQLGRVKAEFTLKDKTLKGFIGSDNPKGLELLQKSSSELDAATAENSVSLKQLDFGVVRSENDTYSYQNTNTEENTASMNADTERILYRIAKAIVRTVRTAENSDLAS